MLPRGGRGSGEGTLEALAGRRVVEQPAKKPFSGGSDKDGGVQGGAQGFDVPEQGNVVLEGFPEPDARIEDDPFARDALLESPFHALAKKAADLRHHVGVDGILLHGFGGAEHVHQDNGGVGVGDETSHGGVTAQGGDVVDDGGAGLEAGAGDLALGGVNADGERIVCCGEFANDRFHACAFLVGGNGIGPGPGGLAADVEEIGAFLGDFPRSGDGVAGGGEPAAITEGIRRDIEDAHNEGRLAAGDGGMRDGPAEGHGQRGE